MDIALITGASSGLGAIYAKTIIDLCPELDEIWLIARRKDRLEQFAMTHPQMRIRSIPLDLSMDSSYSELGSMLAEYDPNIRILINNAGAERTDPFASMSEADLLTMINVNVKGVTMVSRICLPYMKAGSICIMTCSVSYFFPVPDQSVYSASKAYVQFLSRALREEFRKQKVNILALCPGNMDTEMNPKGGESQSAIVDKLPFLDMDKITRKSISKARKGKATYTPGAFYGFYMIMTRIMPSSLMMKIVGRTYR